MQVKTLHRGETFRHPNFYVFEFRVLSPLKHLTCCMEHIHWAHTQGEDSVVLFLLLFTVEHPIRALQIEHTIEKPLGPICPLSNNYILDNLPKMAGPFICCIFICIGLVTNGEWNSLRTKGNTRPLSVLEIRSNIRLKYGRMGEKKMKKMLTPQRNHANTCMLTRFFCLFIGLVDGTITAVEHNPAVSQSLLKEVDGWKQEDCSDMDVITRLRQRTVPQGYKFHNWVKGQ